MGRQPALRALLSPRRSLPVAILLAAAAAAAADAGSAKVERLPIVDRAIEHHGGDLYRRSVTSLSVCSLSGCFEIGARQQGGRYDYTVEGEVGGVRRRVRVTNDRVERWDDGEPVVLDPDGERRARDFVNARVYFPFLPYRLNDGSTYKQDLGRERWGERELHKVKVTFAPGSSTEADDEYLFWFDPEEGRLEQFAYSYGEGDRAGLRFRRLHNYRRAGGILFADQHNLGAEAPGIRVDVVTPEFVATGLRPVSEVTLRDIEVEPLEP